MIFRKKNKNNMANYIVSEPSRGEDGSFIITLIDEEGNVLVEGVGESEEAAIEDAKSKL